MRGFRQLLARRNEAGDKPTSQKELFVSHIESTDSPHLDHGSLEGPYDYPFWPPPAPAELQKNRDEYLLRVQSRKHSAPKGASEYTSLDALYSLYELFILDQFIVFWAAVNDFVLHDAWAVCDIQDPKDRDNGRYAVLASITGILVHQCNDRLRHGQSRGDMTFRSPNTPYETLPGWAIYAPRLKKTLVLRPERGVISREVISPDDRDLFDSKNVLIVNPRSFQFLADGVA